MKKKLFFLVLASILISSLSYAQAPDYLESSANKLQYGIVNSLTGWLEIPFQIGKGFKYGFGKEGKAKLMGAFFGVFRGIVHAIGRTTSGVVELVTFALPNPKNNQWIGIPLDSQYVWDEGKQYSVFKDGFEPIKNKATRGLYNSFLGIVDMPAQLIKGFNNDKPFIGICNSLTFPFSRIIYGIYDLTTVFLPNPVKNYGYPLEEKYPWDAFNMEKYYNQLYQD